jgi:uncharacterized protein (DUF58 family)
MVPRPLSLTTRGVVALGIAPCSATAGVLLGAEELVLVSIALLVLVCCGLVQSAQRVVRARGTWQVVVDLESADVEVGRPLDVSVTLVAAPAAASLPVWLEDPGHCWVRVHRRAAGPPRRLRLPNPSQAVRVTPRADGAAVRLHDAAPTAHRGVYALRGMRLWCFDSFGLVAQLLTVGPTATITVHPVPLRVEVPDAALRGSEGTEDARHEAPAAHLKRTGSGDFSGIRPYVPGDRLRLLYWPALARTGELMVRDFEEPRRPRVHLMADVRALLGAPGCERVLATAAGVGLRVLAQGSVVELSTTSGEHIAIGPGPLADMALLRAIAGMDTAEPVPPPRWWRRRRGAAPEPDRRAPHPVAGAPLVVTTAAGATTLPDTLGRSHLVVAP